MSETQTAEFDALLDLIKRSRGFDFTGYKPSTLSRRIQKRMSVLGIDSYTDYGDLLETEPSEFRHLFNTILINVTSFWRDEAAWAALRTHVVDKLAISREPIRVWTAGCATGEETYTTVMLFAEAMGIERFKRQVKIYATDIDNDSLEHARNATYSAKRLEALPEELRERYFESGSNGFVFRNDLRRSLIFGRHDLLSDPPISRLDLLICRNTLIYFNAEAQSRILARFNFGLKQDGVLFLGKSEMLLTHARLFAPIDVPMRIFRKVSGPDLRDRLAITPAAARRTQVMRQAGGDMSDQQLQFREVSFESAPVSQILLDPAGNLILANQQARRNLNITEADIGRPVQDLDISYRPLEIRSKIDEVHATLVPVTIHGVEHRLKGAVAFFDIQIEPLLESQNELLGVSVSYVDVTASHRLRLEVERAQHALETAYEELQATNEELETTNEELQSSIEELETTNEELQ
ncbi:MAG TPA: CheR family methyltransferase, partial [Longimicrobiales bacterium]